MGPLITILSAIVTLVVAILAWRLYVRMKTLRARDTENRFGTFLLMREYAFCDAGLDKLLKIMGNIDTPMKAAVSAAVDGDYAGAQELLNKAEGEPDVLYYLVLAKIRQAAGNIDGAREAAANILTPDEESRAKISAWSVLRELGRNPDASEADQVLGVVCEFTLGKTLVVVAGYSDGDARLLNSSGLAIIGLMQQQPGISEAAKMLVSTVQPLVGSLEKTDSHPLPELGKFRITVLTPGGMRIKETPMSEIGEQSPEWSMISPVWSAMQDLIKNIRLTAQEMGFQAEAEELGNG